MLCKYNSFSTKAFNIFASMNILIVSATNKESYSSKLFNIENLITGIGIANTISNLSPRLIKFNYDFLINIGICGSFDRRYNLGDVVEINEDCFSELGYEDDDKFRLFDNYNEINQFFKFKSKTHLDSVKGITVNTVHGHEKSIEKVVKQFNPIVESMEGAACMMLAKQYTIPMIQIRGISNYVEKRNKDSWKIDLAINNLHMELEKILNKL